MSKIISHTNSGPGNKAVVQHLAEARARLDATPAPSGFEPEVDAMFDWLEKSPLGRFFLVNRGLNGYWTKYVIRLGGDNPFNHPFETWFLTKNPAILSTRERFSLFQQEIQRSLKPDVRMASVPCGLMDDFLSLDFKGISNSDFTLIGVDLDSESIQGAQEESRKRKLSEHCQFIESDAWGFELDRPVDLITSNGLNIYEKDDDRVTALYAHLGSQLKVGGKFVTSFLTPPEPPVSDTPIPRDFVLMQLLFGQVVPAGWQCFRSEALTRSQLEKAGFTVEQVLYTSTRRFPTVVASRAR